jgi:hypothetical protein
MIFGVRGRIPIAQRNGLFQGFNSGFGIGVPQSLVFRRLAIQFHQIRVIRVIRGKGPLPSPAPRALRSPAIKPVQAEDVLRHHALQSIQMPN